MQSAAWMWARRFLVLLGVGAVMVVVGSLLASSFRKGQWDRYVRHRYGDQKDEPPDAPAP